METINRRNTDTFEQAIKAVNAKIFEQQTQINGLLATISTLSDRVNSIELRSNIEKAKSMGSGPSEKT